MTAWADQLTLVANAPEPIYRQLVEQVRRRVASGAWPPGTEVPSVRELAHALAINPMTVSKAYGLLEADGILERRRGLSMVVAARPAGGASAEELLRPTLERAAAEARELGLPPDRALALFAEILATDPDQE